MSLAAILVIIFSIVVCMAAITVILVLFLMKYNLERDVEQLIRHNAKLAAYIREKDSDGWVRKPVRSHSNKSSAVRSLDHKPARHSFVQDEQGITTVGIIPAMDAVGLVRADSTLTEDETRKMIEEDAHFYRRWISDPTDDEPREQQPETDQVRMVPQTMGRITKLVAA